MRRLIEEALVDAYGENEQHGAFLVMLKDQYLGGASPSDAARCAKIGWHEFRGRQADPSGPEELGRQILGAVKRLGDPSVFKQVILEDISLAKG